MTGDAQKSPTYLVVGTNHVSGNLSLRDKLFVEDADVAPFLSRIRDTGIAQAVVFSTCDRVEVLAAVEDCDSAEMHLTQLMAGHGDVPAADLQPALYRRDGTEAARHVFRVASSLDSMVVGEPQVLGQVKACHRLARDADMVGSDLERLLQSSYSCAKRIRTETAIGERPVSIASVAIGITRDIHGDLENVRGLVLGTGDMGDVIARELLRAGLGELGVADVYGLSSQNLAQALDVRHVTSDGLAAALAEADVIVTAAGGRGQVLSADMVRTALRARRFKPQFIVDASLPSDVEASIDRIDDAFLYDLSDLERLAMEGRASRELEAHAAEEIVTEEVAAFLSQRRERAAVPALKLLREHVEQMRGDVLSEAPADAERATHLLVQRLLHEPSQRLRDMSDDEKSLEQAEKLLRRLFGLKTNGDDDR